MVKTNIKDLPFMQAVISNIKVEDGFLYFTVCSQNYIRNRYKVKEPKNKAWINSDAYTRVQPLAVVVVPYKSATGLEYAYLQPNYDTNIKDK